MAKFLVGSTDEWKIYCETKWFKVKDIYLANSSGRKMQSITNEEWKEYDKHGSVEQVAYKVYKRNLDAMMKDMKRFELGRGSTYCGNTLVVYIGNESIRIAANHEEIKILLARNKFPFIYDHNIRAEEVKYGIKEYIYEGLISSIGSHYVGYEKEKTKYEKI